MRRVVAFVKTKKATKKHTNCYLIELVAAESIANKCGFYRNDEETRGEFLIRVIKTMKLDIKKLRYELERISENRIVSKDELLTRLTEIFK